MQITKEVGRLRDGSAVFDPFGATKGLPDDGLLEGVLSTIQPPRSGWFHACVRSPVLLPDRTNLVLTETHSVRPLRFVYARRIQPFRFTRPECRPGFSRFAVGATPQLTRFVAAVLHPESVGNYYLTAFQVGPLPAVEPW